jgi:hypothetical protein
MRTGVGNRSRSRDESSKPVESDEGPVGVDPWKVLERLDPLLTSGPRPAGQTPVARERVFARFAFGFGRPASPRDNQVFVPPGTLDGHEAPLKRALRTVARAVSWASVNSQLFPRRQKHAHRATKTAGSR